MTNSRPAERSPASEIDFFAEGFCPALTLEDGAQFQLYPEQRAMLVEYFDGARETLILIGKKNGKTTLLAALALYHLTTTPDASCFIAAASRDQATILYDQARGFVRRSKWLEDEVDVKAGYRQIRSKRDSGLLRVLAADADTADGVLPTLALVDELHRHKKADLYGIFRDGLGPRGGRMVTISTAGDDADTPLGRLRAAAYGLPGLKREGAHRHVHTGDFAMHEWALEADDDLDDIALVKTANPAPWQTPKVLRERHDSPSMTPWQWARFAGNVWVSGEDAWLPLGTWESFELEGQIEPGAPVWLGVDLGLKHDTAAIVAVSPLPAEDEFFAEAVILEPPTDGSALDIAAVEHEVRRAAERWDVMAVSYDPWRFERSAQILGDEGLLLVEHPMTNSRMAPESEALHEAIMSGRVRHGGDMTFTAHVNAGSPMETDRGWRLTKRKAKGKIDALIALLMAYDLATRVSKPREVIFT